MHAEQPFLFLLSFRMGSLWGLGFCDWLALSFLIGRPSFDQNDLPWIDEWMDERTDRLHGQMDGSVGTWTDG